METVIAIMALLSVLGLVLVAFVGYRMWRKEEEAPQVEPASTGGGGGPKEPA